MDWALRRSDAGPSRPALWGSIGLHVGVMTALVASAVFEREPLDFVTYEIRMVAMPAQQAEVEQPEPAAEELVVETPDPTPPEPEPDNLPAPPVDEPEPDPDPEPESDPEPQPPEPEPDPEPPTADEPAPPRAEPDPAEEPAETSADNVNVRLEGLRRDYPLYYENIIRQIERCFSPPGGVRAVTAVVYFEIRRDGTVSGLRFVQRSGIADFDLAALAAVGDCAGRGRFGALPGDLPYDRLPVQFTFQPRR